MTTPQTRHHPVVSRDRWLAERQALLDREKALTRLGDEVSAARRALPWVQLAQDYRFDTVEGPRGLSELFQGRRQLLVQHFMFGPGWEQGCKSCSFMTDHLDGMAIHLAHRDIALLLVSSAPLAEIERFRQRMGWRLPWVSSQGSDFNRDFQVSFTAKELARGEVFYNYGWSSFPLTEAPGISVFCRDDSGQLFHSYSTYGRGLEVMMGAYGLMDLTPQGRGEDELDFRMAWVRHHDRYEDAPAAACCSSTAPA
ncbi:MAG: DUF899 domain-containing protein [Burkholderiales bacterium]|nr:MAG: DUF899 domain-containing protein [Burkholderiales bacterium]